MACTRPRDELFEEARLRDLRVQRCVDRDFGDSGAPAVLPIALQQEVNVVRDLYASAAAAGHPQAAYNLGLMYYLGKGVGRDLKRAVKWLERAAGCGHGEARFLLGHPDAQYNLALLYLSGDHAAGVARDPLRAAELLGGAADQGHVEAQYRLGRLFLTGGVLGLPRDTAKAWALLQAASAAGKAEAAALLRRDLSGGGGGGSGGSGSGGEQHFCLGQMYEAGSEPHLLGPGSLSRAAECYRLAALAGHREAGHRLGLLYQRGLAAPPLAKGATAAAAAPPPADNPLTSRLASTLPASPPPPSFFFKSPAASLPLTPASLAASGPALPAAAATTASAHASNAAVSWFRRSAAAGCAAAQHHLGLCHYHGEGGVPRDLVRARAYWRRAAAQGHADAQFSLGFLYYHGEVCGGCGGGGCGGGGCGGGGCGGGGGRDPRSAASLLAEAAAQGHAKAATLLAFMYFHGDFGVGAAGAALGGGEGRDPWTAAVHARCGAAAGEPDALFLLGVMHETGEGVPHRDRAAAAQCLRAAADRGHADAEARLQRLLLYGGSSSSSSSSSLFSARPPLTGPLVGETAVVHSMPHSLGVNGRRCVVLSYDPIAGRFVVELTDTGRVTQFHPGNLVPLR